LRGVWLGPTAAAGDCFSDILVESLAKSGYVAAPRLQQTYSWLLGRQRLDGGFRCKNTGLPGAPREREPSCAFATLCVMGAIIQNPQLKNGKVSQKDLRFLLRCWENGEKIKYAGHDSRIGTGWEKLKYPFTDYRILKYLDVLSSFEATQNDPRMNEMINLLFSRPNINGRYPAESIHTVWSDFDFGQKQLPGRWITFLIYRIISRYIAPLLK